MIKVMYVSLDDRACNYEFPYSLAELTDNITLLRPPYSLMGRLKQPADMEAIWEWVEQNASACQYAILSVDTLVYGNLLNSRIHHYTKEECSSRLERFRTLKAKAPALKIHAFNLVARVAAYDNNFEDPEYWSEYGYMIWCYTCLMDKQERKQITEQEQEQDEMHTLKDRIPKEYFDDFFARREVDWRCQSNLTPTLLEEMASEDKVDPFYLNEHLPAIQQHYSNSLEEWLNGYLAEWYPELKLRTFDYKVDWNSIFFSNIKIEPDYRK